MHDLIRFALLSVSRYLLLFFCLQSSSWLLVANSKRKFYIGSTYLPDIHFKFQLWFFESCYNLDIYFPHTAYPAIPNDGFSLGHLLASHSRRGFEQVSTEESDDDRAESDQPA